ncbi:MAG: DUF11 domain-containing protein [Candidatus Peribacteria bacterium]|nr:DUF11 domain-containing protein [Candidatus Peribacteria bacterium]
MWITKRFLDGSTRPTYKIGDTVEYRIDFGNNGNAPATVVSLRDFVPQNLTGISSILYRTDSNSTHFDEIIEGGYVDVYGEITLPAGSQGYFILKGTITATHQDERTNKACIYLNNKEINCARVIYDLETLQSHLRIYKKVDKTEVNVGDIVIFTLEIRNDGQTPMTDFTVADKLPEYVSYVEGSQRGGENFFEFVVDSEARLLVRSNYSATLQPNEFIILTFRAKVESIGRHTNWVCLVHEDLFPSANFGPSENCDPADVVAKETPYCGDGIRNNGERCDYKDPTKSGRGTDGCDTSCNPINDDRPYCGNGVIDSKLKETCECPKGRISCQGRDVIFPDGHRDNNASCTYCHIPNQTTPIACFDVGNGSISINEGEMLPFYRNIEKVDEDSYTELGVDVENVIDTYDRYKKGNQSCNSANEGKIALDAMVCTFRVYNGENIQSDDDYVYELRVPCFTKGSDIQRDRQSSSLISKWIDWNKHNFIKGGNDNGGNTFRSYNILNNNRGFAFRSSVFVINNFGRTSGGSAGRFVDYGEWQQKSERIDVYGEYKLSLHEVNYLQCNNGYRKEQDPYNRVCDVNFSVTKPYIIQKTPAGNVENIKINNTTVDLSKFLMYADGTSTNFSAQLGKVISTGGVYNPTKDVEKALTGFINKYSKLAVALDKNTKLFGNDLGVKVKKVPGKDIYFVEGNLNIDGFRFTYETSKTKIDEVHGTNSVYDRPFTIVQTVGNTTIKGNLNHNMMLLTNGTITFDGSKNCNDTQVVKGIFYSSAIQ